MTQTTPWSFRLRYMFAMDQFLHSFNNLASSLYSASLFSTSLWWKAALAKHSFLGVALLYFPHLGSHGSHWLFRVLWPWSATFSCSDRFNSTSYGSFQYARPQVIALHFPNQIWVVQLSSSPCEDDHNSLKKENNKCCQGGGEIGALMPCWWEWKRVQLLRKTV